jgi:hypothetical protein
MALLVQRALHCRCGKPKIIALGLCATCYTLKRQDEEYFGGLREQLFQAHDHRRVEIAVARRELVSVKEQQPEVDLVGAVGVGGVPLRLDVGGVVVQDVEDEMRLVLVGADDAGVAGHVVGDQGTRCRAWVAVASTARVVL